MALQLDKKQWMMGGALLLTLGLSAWLALGTDKADGPEVVEPAKSASVKRIATPNRTGALSLPVLANVRASGMNEQQADDIFRPKNWIEVPPQSLKAQPAVIPPELAPQPPPMPFTYMGTVDDSGQRIVFLAKQKRLFTVHKGETFDGQYRLESESPGRIELVYLPLNAKQTLVTKGAS